MRGSLLWGLPCPENIATVQDDVLAKLDRMGRSELLYYRPNSRIMWNNRVSDVGSGCSIMLD